MFHLPSPFRKISDIDFWKTREITYRRKNRRFLEAFTEVASAASDLDFSSAFFRFLQLCARPARSSNQGRRRKWGNRFRVRRVPKIASFIGKTMMNGFWNTLFEKRYKFRSYNCNDMCPYKFYAVDTHIILSWDSIEYNSILNFAEAAWSEWSLSKNFCRGASCFCLILRWEANITYLSMQ